MEPHRSTHPRTHGGASPQGGGIVTDGSLPPSDDAKVDGTCTREEVHGPSAVNLYPILANYQLLPYLIEELQRL